MIHRNMEDKRMKATITNKSGVSIHGLKPGGKLPIEVDKDGTPLDKKWRRRVADSKIDNAVSLTDTPEVAGPKVTPMTKITKKKQEARNGRDHK